MKELHTSILKMAADLLAHFVSAVPQISLVLIPDSAESSPDLQPAFTEPCDPSQNKTSRSILLLVALWCKAQCHCQLKFYLVSCKTTIQILF